MTEIGEIFSSNEVGDIPNAESRQQTRALDFWASGVASSIWKIITLEQKSEQLLRGGFSRHFLESLISS